MYQLLKKHHYKKKKMSHHAFFAFSILTQKTNFVFQSFDYSVSIVLFSLIKTSFSTAETEIKNILTLQEKYTRVYPLSDSAGIYIVKTLETHALIQRLLPGISFDVIKPNDSNHRVWVNLVFSILDPSLNLDSFVPSSSSSSSSFSSSSSSSFSFSFLQSLSSDALLEKQKKEFLNTNQIQIITESDNKNYAAHTNLENYVYFTNEKDAFYKLPVGDAKTAFVNKWKRIFCNTGWLQPTKAWLVKLTAEFNHFFKEKEITIKELKFSFHNYKNAQINKSLTLFLNFLSRGVVDTTQQQFKSFLEQFSSDPFFKSIEEKSLYDKTEIASLLFSRFKSRKVLFLLFFFDCFALPCCLVALLPCCLCFGKKFFNRYCKLIENENKSRSCHQKNQMKNSMTLIVNQTKRKM
jgi:hypothetical protein